MRQAGPLAALAACALVVSGCVGQKPDPAPSTPSARATPAPSTPTPSQEPLRIPDRLPREIARDQWVDGQRAATPGTATITDEAWLAQGACDGGGDLAVSYHVFVDDAEVDSGTVVCSTGITYANTALSQVRGEHRIRVVMGDEVEGSRRAWVRGVPEADVLK